MSFFQKRGTCDFCGYQTPPRLTDGAVRDYMAKNGWAVVLMGGKEQIICKRCRER